MKKFITNLSKAINKSFMISDETGCTTYNQAINPKAFYMVNRTMWI